MIDKHNDMKYCVFPYRLRENFLRLLLPKEASKCN